MSEILAILTAIGLPFAYDHFAEGESPNPPFVVYLFPNSANFFADGKVYKPIEVVHFELYTDKKDTQSESLVENALGNHGIAWQKAETWIPEERLYDVVYSFEKEM